MDLDKEKRAKEDELILAWYKIPILKIFLKLYTAYLTAVDDATNALKTQFIENKPHLKLLIIEIFDKLYLEHKNNTKTILDLKEKQLKEILFKTPLSFSVPRIDDSRSEGCSEIEIKRLRKEVEELEVKHQRKKIASALLRNELEVIDNIEKFMTTVNKVFTRCEKGSKQRLPNAFIRYTQQVKHKMNQLESDVAEFKFTSLKDT